MSALAEGVDATFVPAPPGHPPGAGTLALWPVDASNGGGQPLTLVLARGRTVRRTTVPSRAVPVGDALAALVDLPADAAATRSLAGWAVAAQVAVDLVARGRLLPGLSPTARRPGGSARSTRPTTAGSTSWPRPCPPRPTRSRSEGSRPLRIRCPRSLVADFVDAVADRLVRTAAAAAGGGGDLAGGATNRRRSPSPPSPGGWRRPARPADGAVPGLRLELPDGSDSGFRAVVQLRSQRRPEPGRRRRRPVGRARPRCSPGSASRRRDRPAARPAPGRPGVAAARRRLLDEARPDALDARRRRGRRPARRRPPRSSPAAGFEVLWPAELLRRRSTLRAVVQHAGARRRRRRRASTLDQLLELPLGGDASAARCSTAEEVRRAGRGQAPARPAARAGGCRPTPTLAERLRRRGPPAAAPAEALAAALDRARSTTSTATQVEVAGRGRPLADAGRPPARRRRRPTADAGRAAAASTATLRPYQRRGLAWLAEMAELGLGGCLADDMGLGKTIQVIALHLHRRRRRAPRRPTLVVCPASLLGNWEREIERFAPDVPVRRYHGGDRHLDDLAADEIVLATYGVVRRDRAALAEVGWGLVVADEAQHVKNPLAAHGPGAARRCPAPARVALTGTPVENRLTELWSILDWTTPGPARPARGVPPHAWPCPSSATATPTRPSGSPALVRPVPAAPAQDRPRHRARAAAEDRDRRRRARSPPSRPRSTRRSCARRWPRSPRPRASRGAGLVLKLLTALKQICNHPAQLPRPGRPARRAGRASSTPSTSCSTSILDEGESVLVFTPVRRPWAGCSSATSAARGVAHAVPARRRAGGRGATSMVDRFQAGEVPVFLLSLKAGGTGLNLTRATHVVHYDRWWNPAVEDQATDRAYRIGQDRPVQVHRLVTEGTVEDRIGGPARSASAALADAVVGAGEAWIGELTDDELADLVALRTRAVTPPVGPGAGAVAAGRRRAFGATWWGEAWIDALEQRARLDPNRLPRGRTYARQGRVGALDRRRRARSRRPVQGSRASAVPGDASRVRPLHRRPSGTGCSTPSPARAGHAAALLDGELPPEIVADVAAGRARPAARRRRARAPAAPAPTGPTRASTPPPSATWSPTCSTTTRSPCSLLRGRDRERGAGRAAGPTGGRRGDRPAADGRASTPGVAPAGVASNASRPALPSPAAAAGPSRTARSRRRRPAAGAACAVDRLVALAADAARRAWELATGAGDGGLGLGRDADLARRSAAALGTPALADLAVGAALPERRLVTLATAWEHGREGGVAVVVRPAAPPAEVLDGARRSLTAAGQRVRVTRRRPHGGRHRCPASLRRRRPLVSAGAAGRELGGRRRA